MNNEGLINLKAEEDFEILICPFCMIEIPLISFSVSEDVIYLHINCFCVKGVKTIELEKYYDIFQSSLRKSSACNYNQSHYDQPAVLYCDKCASWLCSDCLVIHKAKEREGHVLLPREVHLSCWKHKALFSSFCNDCQSNICAKCREEHTGHSLHDIKKVSNFAFIAETLSIPEITERNRQLKEDMLQLLTNRISELTKWKEEIEQLYLQNAKMNAEFERLINLILKTNSFSLSSPNYVFNQIYTKMHINYEVVSLNKTTIDYNYILCKNHFLNSFLLTLNDSIEVNRISENESTDEVFNQEHVQSKLVGTLQGHSNSVKCLIQLNDGRIASSSWDNSIKLWDLTEMKLLSTLEGHSYYVWAIIQLKDGRLASCSGDNTIRIWDLSVCMCMNTITGDSFTDIIQLANGTLATCSKQTIQLWDIELFECLHTIEAHSKNIWCLTELHDGRLVSSSYDCLIKVWSSASLEYIDTIKGHSESVNCLIQLEDERLASCSDDKTIRLWDINSFKQLGSFIGHRSWVFCIVQLKDGRLVSSGNDKSLRFWNISTCQSLDIIQQNDSIEFVVMQLSDGRLASGSGDWLNNKAEGVISIWKV